VRLLTASYGVRSAIARGALRPRSRHGGALEPFAEGTATLHLREGRELQTLTAFELTRSPQPLGHDLLRFAGASLLAELVLRTASEESQPGLFQALRSAFDRVRELHGSALESVILAGAWTLVATLGFAPSLTECVSCGRTLESAEDTRFDYTAGSVSCRRCTSNSPGRDLPASARAVLAQLTSGNAIALDHTAAHWRLLRRYLDHHVLEGGNLRSLAFLDRALEDAECAH
jgi:DNA repair protein RecO (recombination protein O)